MGLVMRVSFVMLLIMAIFTIGLQAEAARPTVTGIKYPWTVWSDTGTKITITGRIGVLSHDSPPIAGAYVAIVNASNPDMAYASATTDANGEFTFINVNATYSIGQGKGNAQAYMIYANKSQYKEGYSTPFGVDADGGSSAITHIALNLFEASSPNPGGPTATPTPTPTPTITPTATPAPAPSSTYNSMASLASPPVATAPAPTSTTTGPIAPNASTPKTTPAISALMAILAIGIVAYCNKNKKY